MPNSRSVTIISKHTIHPDQQTTPTNSLKLSVSDLPMLSCQYIQKGVLLPQPPQHVNLVSLIKLALSKTLSHFPALAGRLHTDPDGHVHILCNDAGIDFVYAKSPHVVCAQLLPSSKTDIPSVFRKFFQFDDMLSYSGHEKPLIAVQVTELKDAVFVGCTVNHAVVDGTSFWNFFNVFAEMARGVDNNVSKTRTPSFRRDTVFDTKEVLNFPAGGPVATFSGDDPIREKIFHFTREDILRLKFRANNPTARSTEFISGPEMWGKKSNDGWGGVNNGKTNSTVEISSFQSLCAHLWRCVTRARNLDSGKTTTFRMAVNCRHRLEPRMETLYFGNAIQSIPTVATVGDLLGNGLSWGADRLHRNVVAHGDATVRKGVKDWESNPRLFPLGNFDGAMITMGSSPRFPMYDNDFGWGRPLAVRSGKANKFDGKISAFPGADGNGSIDLEVVLAPETMAGLENDFEFMQFVS